MVTRYFSRRFEDSLLAFRILEGTSDPQAPVTNTESGPAADREASSGRWPPAIDRHPPASMSTDGAESNDLCDLSLIMGDDQRDHRARVARICRGILVFSASKTFFKPVCISPNILKNRPNLPIMFQDMCSRNL